MRSGGVGASHWNHGDCTKRYIWIENPAPPYAAHGRSVSIVLLCSRMHSIEFNSMRSQQGGIVEKKTGYPPAILSLPPPL